MVSVYTGAAAHRVGGLKSTDPVDARFNPPRTSYGLQPEDLDVHAPDVVDERRRRGRLGQAGRADQLVVEAEQPGPLDRVRRVVYLPTQQPISTLDVQVVAL